MDMHGLEAWRIFRMTANTTTAQDVPRSTIHGAERHWSLMGNRMVCRGVPLSISMHVGEWRLCLPRFHHCAMTNRTLNNLIFFLRDGDN